MIPSVLAQQLQHGVEDFLRTTFPVSTPHFHRLIERLLTEDGGIFKGPYISAQLPFRQGSGDGEFFEHVPLGWRPFLHQEQAFRRLGGDAPKSTLVATGTGSGKTESFLLPILDYCYRHRKKSGVKAIFVYPMNALANDQAARIAGMIAGNERLKGKVRAGLYVGQRETGPRRTMEPGGIITDRDTLRLDPPDILLTNYKMLDYLLVRPEDFPLWKHNDPETLRFMVVDELHTFDGAQGTDLACLIRRLQARLRTPASHLCCVGTSATLGGARARSALTGYATQIFGQPFDDASVIMESRQSDSEFLEGSYVQAKAPVGPERAAILDPARYEHHDTYLRAQAEGWFGIQADDLSDPSWRVELGEALKSHPLFRNLLTVLKGRVKSLEQLDEALTRATPELKDSDAAYHRNLFDSLLALVAAARVWVTESAEKRLAREAEGKARATRPLVELRIQLWLRELRRMVASVEADPRLTFFDDLSDEKQETHLPVVHCRDCGSTGWGARKRAMDTQLDAGLKDFYQAFFSYHPNTVFIFPGTPAEGHDPDGTWHWLTPGLRLDQSKPDEGGIRVFLPDSSRKSETGRAYVHHDCPFCESRNSLTILGSRAASLTSVLITQLYASSYNEDKKLIAFSDSVQDASHRAGFFGARTYRFNIRSAIQQFVDGWATDHPDTKLTLAALPRALAAHYRSEWSDAKYIAAFLAPDMEWLEDYEKLVESGKLPTGSNLTELVDRRIEWEVLSEFGHRSRIGRSLEKSGTAIAAVDPARLDAAAGRLCEVIPNELGGFQGLEPATVRIFLLGVLSHLRVRGGIHQPWLAAFIESGGNTFLLNRQPYMPSLPPNSRILSFATRTKHAAFDALNSGSTTATRTWYEEWAEKCFSSVNPMVTAVLWDLFDHVLTALLEAELLLESTTKGDLVWGVDPNALRIERDVLTMKCFACGHLSAIAGHEGTDWEDAPCLRFRCGGRYREERSETLDYYGALYSTGALQRIIAREHTGLQERERREALERSFIHGDQPWSPNLLSCTPTLEMGIDIGDLSTVLLCSIPPAQANYIQRIGRAGRRDGNALNVAVATGQPHDLYFYAQPEEMIEGEIQPPGVFLRAAAVLERQMTAFCLDRWVETELPPGAIPSNMRPVLDGLSQSKSKGFPFNFLAFVESRKEKLVDGFLEMFGDELDDDARSHVRTFAVGSGSVQAPFDHKLLNGLKDLERERAGLTKTVERLRRRVREMEGLKARDKNYDEELSQLRNERDALSRIVRENIDRRHTLNFLTDEGLIPNYAFPEAGVVLRSVIYRRKSEKRETSEGGSYDTRVFEYERPAVRAITELAPSSQFYADGRNVTIDRIDLTVADVESWRLCDNCSFSSIELVDEARLTCPRCGSRQWSDSGQQHPMVRMRQVFASTSDKRSRTGDDSDDRRPVFFKRQLLVDYEDTSITSAFSIEDEEVPFGFEFLSRVEFREINFGENSMDGADVRIAGEEAPRKGFKICRHCGKVPDRRGETKHTLSCPARNRDREDDFIQALFLYREFSSEAIRILLPETTLTGSERTRHSFIAALQLGLKKEFGGGIDHLRVTEFEEPIPDSAHRKRSLILYDSVPGGTGYLKELMRSTGPLLRVFKAALETLRSCPCNSDESKDGCYRCLYAYRNAYDMAETSRESAVALLSKVLKRENQFRKVDSLRHLPVNALFDSELEARFVQALEEASTEARPIRVIPQIVGRTAGYLLKVGEQSYYIEPQVSLGHADGVTLPSRADFVLRPARAGQGAKSIVVFLDGWTYHHDRIGQDLAQRTAISRSGRYLVWSLSWKDIEKAESGDRAHFQELLSPKGPVAGNGQFEALINGLDAKHETKRLRDLPDEGAFQWLLRYLASPDPKGWQAHAMIQALLHLDPAASKTDDGRSIWKSDVASQLPGGVSDLLLDLEPESRGGGPMGGLPVRTYLAARDASVRQLDPTGLSFVCVLDDGEVMKGRPDFQAVWNGVLRLQVLIQFLPGGVVLSTSTFTTGLHNDLDLGVGSLAGHAEGVSANGEDPAWLEARELTLPEARPLVEALAQAGIPAPEVGFELSGANGTVAGMAEFAWPDRSLALLDGSMAEFVGTFESAGWTALSLEDAIADPTAFIQRFSEP